MTFLSIHISSRLITLPSFHSLHFLTILNTLSSFPLPVSLLLSSIFVFYKIFIYLIQLPATFAVHKSPSTIQPFLSQYTLYLHLPTPLPSLLCASQFSFFSPFLCITRTPGPKASGGEGDKGCGFRGPGETKMETDKRAIREKIVLLTREISLLGMQREQHRRSRYVQYSTVYVRSLCHRLGS